jgi:outer membrane protein, multidrug efflux system
MKKTGLYVALLLSLGACKLGPDYIKPSMAPPAKFENTIAGANMSEADLQKFWLSFNDETLSKLVDQALVANHDIRIAAARLDEARASRRSALFDLWPVVTSNLGRQRSSRAAAETPGVPADGLRSDYYEAGFDASWEVSVFGRGQRGVEAQNAFARAALAQTWASKVTVSAEVARQYFELRGLQMRLDVATRNADNQTESLRITKARLDAGRGTDFDRARAQAQLEITLAGIPSLQAAIAKNIYRISVLCGQNPSELTAMLDANKPLPTLPDVVPQADPTALLQRRPDVIAAEENLIARNALIGYRKAELFPRVTFTGRSGFAAENLGDLGSSGSSSWRFGPSISWPAFDLGRVMQNVKVERARTQIALAEYQKSVLLALEDTEGALISYGRSASTLDHLQKAVIASDEALNLAKIRFENGATDFLSVLDADRAKLQAEDQFASAKTNSATALVAVYKAFGGGY